MKLPGTELVAYKTLTKEQFDEAIDKGIDDIKAGRIYSAEMVEAELKKDFDIKNVWVKQADNKI